MQSLVSSKIILSKVIEEKPLGEIRNVPSNFCKQTSEHFTVMRGSFSVINVPVGSFSQDCSLF